MSARTDFGMYLETAGTGESSRYFREQIGDEAAKSLHFVWSGYIVIGKTTPDSIIDILGQPDYRTQRTLSYLLPQRTVYYYTFTFDSEYGVLMDHGYQHINPLPNLSEDAAKWQAYVNQLTIHGATTQDLLRWLGEPLERYGWWPVETWEYTDGRHIHFRHGIVSHDV